MAERKTRDMSHPPFGVNLFGYVSGNFGLAVAARNTLEMLLATQTPVAVHDAKLYDGRSGHHNEYESLYANGSAPMPYGINLFQLNPDDVLNRIPLQWIRIPVETRFNVIVPFWELPSLPDIWCEGLGMMDLVLAPTLYIKEIVEAAVPDATVVHFPQAVHVPAGIVSDRARWGIAEGDVAFLSSFDVLSDMERKNPWGAIEAFQRAFPAEQTAPVRLLIKLNNAGVNTAYAPLVERLFAEAAADPRIRVIDERLPYADVLSLYASCDAFVSLHRAEGLGLILMEMMTLGKPVITTAWSGNMDFSTAENSALVGFEMIPISASHLAYRDEVGSNEQVRWADPSLDEAAEWMRKLAVDAALRERLGARASADMAARLCEHNSPAIVDELRRRYEAFDEAASPHASKAGAIRAWRRKMAVRRIARLPRAAVLIVARKLGLYKG